ncbi:MAG: hypothetical protein J6V87_08295 [Prevotella sp.]|nr:hypothetical protein [Prevotella sp.]
MSRHHGTEVLQTHVFVRRWIVYVRYAVHTLSSEQYDDDDIGHRRTLLPLWGTSPVVQGPLKGDTRSLSGGLRGFGGVRRMRPVQVPSDEGTGETEATLADNGRRPRQPTCHPGWFPKLHELPGMSKDSTLAVAQSGTCPPMRSRRE